MTEENNLVSAHSSIQVRDGDVEGGIKPKIKTVYPPCGLRCFSSASIARLPAEILASSEA